MTTFFCTFQEKTGISVVRLLHILIVLFSLLGTQFVFPVNILSRTIYLYYVEIFLFCVLVIVSIITLKKRKGNLLKRTEGVLFALFIVWFFLLTVYRYVSSGNVTGGFIVFRVLTFPILLVWMLRQMNTNKNDILFGVLLFITSMNIYQVYSIFITRSFRTVYALKNINIYLCFMLAALPLLFMMLKQLKFSSKVICGFVTIIIPFNILTILVFSFFSGSRIAVVILPIVFFCSFLLTNGFNKKSLVRLGGLVVSFALLVSIILQCNIFDAKYNVTRTWFEVLNTLGVQLSFTDIDERNVQDTENSTWTDGGENEEGFVENEDSTNNGFSEFGYSEVENTVIDSNNMRYKLWKQSIEYIKESPFWGRTSIDIEVEMNFAGYATPVKIIQSPHNFILEGWLALGFPGMIIYGIIIAITVISIMRKRIKASIKANMFIVLFVIFGFSFFQPLVTCYFAISLILWFNLYLCNEN